MKKIVGLLIVTISILFISGCSQANLADRLQENDWNVVSTKGDAYTASFSDTTVTTAIAGFTAGQQYTINEDNNELSFYKDNTDGEQEVASTYIVKEVEDSDELKLESANDETKEEYGDLTLSPIENETKQ